MVRCLYVANRSGRDCWVCARNGDDGWVQVTAEQLTRTFSRRVDEGAIRLTSSRRHSELITS